MDRNIAQQDRFSRTRECQSQFRQMRPAPSQADRMADLAGGTGQGQPGGAEIEAVVIGYMLESVSHQQRVISVERAT